jgi:hypothetical protein
MLKDSLAIVGIGLLLLGLGVIYFPLALCLAGLLLSGSCIWLAYIEGRNNK